MQSDKRTYRRLDEIKKINHKNSNIIELPECPRINYSLDMPLKKPCLRCCFRRKYKRECIPHPSLYHLLNDKGIEYYFSTRFKCVVNNEYLKNKRGAING